MTAHTATQDTVGAARALQFARVITTVGVIVGVFSLVQTVAHVSDSGYLIEGLEDGSGHVQYHMTRETFMNIGLFAVLLLGVFAPRSSRTASLWWLMLTASVAYFAAMWVGVLILSDAVPSAPALIVHTISSLALLAGVLLARPAYRAYATAQDTGG